MEIMMVVLLIASFGGMAIYSLIGKSSGKESTKNIVGLTTEDRNIENLHRMQNYKFWRDFDK